MIHHEDFGGYLGTEDAWQQRCARCRRQWPNNSLKAPDGGAGGLAKGYSALIGAVNSVRHPVDSYDASRDCLIILTSPVYAVDSPSSSDWSNVLELWKNIGLQLPRANNVLACFRETFPQPYGGEGWIKAFNSTMTAAGLNLSAYLFFFGGADSYYTNYPSTGAPALDVVFRGAAAIGNASGDFYEEPMEIVNAQYEWNARPSSFSRNPRTYQEAMDLLQDYVYKDQPRELFDANGIYRTACNLLYGPHAGPIMASYYQESKRIMDIPSETAEGEQNYLPKMFDRAYAIPEHWRDLAVDAKTWDLKIEDRAYTAALTRLHIDLKELHRRLARHWAILAELNAKGAQDVAESLRSDPRPASIEGLKFLTTSFQVDQPLLEALADFHRGMEACFTSAQGNEEAKADFQKASQGAKKSHELALQAFPNPIDPVGGEVGAIRDYSARLAEAIERMPR